MCDISFSVFTPGSTFRTLNKHATTKQTGDDEDDDDEEYEVDYANMNVSPEILRMLGASEEVIAAKEAEISATKWVAPTETGLEHSSALADFKDVAIGKDGGGGKDGSTVQRVFNQVGIYDSAATNPDSLSRDGGSAPAGQAPTDDSRTAAVLKLKITNAPQPVPRKMEFKLPQASAIDDSGSDSGSSGTSWDEASIIDGHGWWETASDEVCVPPDLDGRLISQYTLSGGANGYIHIPSCIICGWFKLPMVHFNT